MKCVKCDGKVKVSDKRTSEHFITIRTYKCVDCNTPFKTREALMFESVPIEIKKNFIATGRRKQY